MTFSRKFYCNFSQLIGVFGSRKKRGNDSDFRSAVRTVFQTCIFHKGETCGFKKHCLQAAHIKPICVCDDSEKFDPLNGILMCEVHHKLFDGGQFTFSDDFTLMLSLTLKSNEAFYANSYNLTAGKKYPLQEGSQKYLSFHRECIFEDSNDTDQLRDVWKWGKPKRWGKPKKVKYIKEKHSRYKPYGIKREIFAITFDNAKEFLETCDEGTYIYHKKELNAIEIELYNNGRIDDLIAFRQWVCNRYERLPNIHKNKNRQNNAFFP